MKLSECISTLRNTLQCLTFALKLCPSSLYKFYWKRVQCRENLRICDEMILGQDQRSWRLMERSNIEWRGTKISFVVRSLRQDGGWSSSVDSVTHRVWSRSSIYFNGSQWRLRVELDCEMWACDPGSHTYRAGACNSLCNGAKVDADTPAIATIQSWKDYFRNKTSCDCRTKRIA